MRVTEQGMAEIDGHQVRCSVPRETLREVSLEFGTLAERPIRQLIMSLIFICLGLTPFRNLAQGQLWVLHPVEWAMIGFLMLGVIAAYGASRKGLYLSVKTDNGCRKLPFKQRPTDEQLDQFVAEAASFGFTINHVAD